MTQPYTREPSLAICKFKTNDCGSTINYTAFSWSCLSLSAAAINSEVRGVHKTVKMRTKGEKTERGEEKTPEK